VNKKDHPLKQLVALFILDFAAWLLHTEVVHAEPRTVELLPSSEAIRADQVFLVTLADGRRVVLHIEFQSRSSHKPMHLRLLDYMVRLVLDYPGMAMYHVVIYVGRGAGQGDDGVYEVLQPDGAATLSWRYQVVRLWEMDAEELVAMGRLALMPLVGQMRIREPERVVPQVVNQMKAVKDEEMKHHLFGALTALMDDVEVLNMIERMIEDDELLLDTPFIQRIREEGREEGREENLRRNTLDAVVVRLRPAEDVVQQIEAALARVDGEERLHDLFMLALQAERVEDVLAAMRQGDGAAG
jgi:predicted transposase YdaD